MIILPQTSTNLDVAEFFSTKRTDIQTYKSNLIPPAMDFCSCVRQCIPDLDVFTDQVGTDFYKNDFSSFFIKTFNQPPFATGSTTSAKIINIDSGVETNLINGTHGTLTEGVFFYWFKLDWYKIWNTLGYGRYRVELKTTSSTSLQVVYELTSPIYHLKPFSEKLANRTVRLEIQQSGNLHHAQDYSNLKTQTIGGQTVIYEQQIRLPGALKFSSMDSENDHLVLNDPNRSSYQIKDQIRPTYDLELYLVSSKQVVKVLFEDLFSNPVSVTDYNVYNFVADPRDPSAEQYRSLPLIRESNEFEASRRNKRKSFTFNMRYFNDNIFKTNN